MCDRPSLPEFQCPGLVQRRLAIIFGLCGVVRFPEIGRTAPARGQVAPVRLAEAAEIFSGGMNLERTRRIKEPFAGPARSGLAKPTS